MAKFWKTKTFFRLRKKWDEKLLQSGFRDAEKEIEKGRVLKDYEYNAYPIDSHFNIRSRFEFYRAIGILAHDEQFMSDRDRHIMTRIADGAKQADILKELADLGFNCTNRITITRVISRYFEKWNIYPSKPRKTK